MAGRAHLEIGGFSLKDKAHVKWTKIHVQIMRITCFLNMGTNLTIRKKWAHIYLSDITWKGLQLRLIIVLFSVGFWLESGKIYNNNDHTCLFYGINTCQVPREMFELSLMALFSNSFLGTWQMLMHKKTYVIPIFQHGIVQGRKSSEHPTLYVHGHSQNTETVAHIKGRILDQAMILFNCIPFQNGNFS